MDDVTRPEDRAALAELIDDAFAVSVGVETAARHLWVIHTEAGTMSEPAAPAAQPPSRASRRVPRAAVPVLALVMLMSSSGVAVAASRGSLPGDVLYPVKRGTEAAQLIFARDPVSRAELQLSFARVRLAEIQQVASSRPQEVPRLVQDIVVTLDAVDSAGSDVAASVQPASERIRRDTTASIVALGLPEADERAVIAMTVPPTDAALQATPTSTPATPPAAVDATPTQVPSEGASATPTTVAGADAVDGALEGVPTTSASPSTASSATATPSPSSSPTPTASPSTGGGSNPGALPVPTASGDDSDEDDEESEQPSPGPVVTSRPPPQEGAGASRSDDEIGTTPPPQQASEEPPPASEGEASEPVPGPIGRRG